jgi:hypothetical protein
MVNRTQAILLRAAAGRDSLPLNLSLHKLLILASHRRGGGAEGRRTPAHRTRVSQPPGDGMKLQADPTVGYAMGRGPRVRSYYSNLRTDSPFNTYLYAGLPPGPICNPAARASRRASIRPRAHVTCSSWRAAKAAICSRNSYSKHHSEHPPREVHHKALSVTSPIRQRRHGRPRNRKPPRPRALNALKRRVRSSLERLFSSREVGVTFARRGSSSRSGALRSDFDLDGRVLPPISPFSFIV